MGKRTSKTKNVTENTFAPWAQNFAQSNINYTDALTSGVMNRFGGGGPDSFIAPFSKDTEDAFTMARGFAGGSTPHDIRAIAADTGGYRGVVARELDARSPLNQAVARSIGTYQGLSNRAAPQFGAQSFDATQVGAVGDVTARQGVGLMNDYLNPYMRDVVDTSLGDYDVGVDRQANQSRARRDAASAFGDRAALADAVFAADSSRGRGSLAAGLRSDAFNTAAGFGMQDANRFLEAERTNQQVALQRAMENARLQQAAAEANAQLRRQHELDLLGAGLSNDQLRMSAAQAQLATAQDQQASQLNLARGLTGLAQDQVGLLNEADAAEQRRIAAQTAVGQAIDERNQAVQREPLDLLEWRARMLGQTPYPTTMTQTGTQRMSGLDALTKGIGIANTLRSWR